MYPARYRLIRDAQKVIYNMLKLFLFYLVRYIFYIRHNLYQVSWNSVNTSNGRSRIKLIDALIKEHFSKEQFPKGGLLVYIHY